MSVIETAAGLPARDKPAELAGLRSARAVRERCRAILRWVEDGRSPHFTLDRGRLPDVAAFVVRVTRQNYPDLAIPPHSRWRHFSAGGIARWDDLSKTIADPIETARAAVDLATVSVLLDAGAGDQWRYREARSGQVLARSEGLGVASLDMFANGAFSSDPNRPLQADANGLKSFDASRLAQGLQSSPDNPLLGLEQRAALLRRLGEALNTRPDLFGDGAARPGHLVDHCFRCGGDRISATDLLGILLEALAPIWPRGLVVDGISIGDAGRHPAACADDVTDGIVPFHKLSQWLTYSLIEPLERAGLRITGLGGLTALAEYRNGGLLVDLGVIRPRRPIEPQFRHEVSSQLVVEWRALTVALMDELLEPVRDLLRLGEDFQLPHLLQGGTWSAGREIARKLRPPAGPSPIPVASDGTVF